MSTKKTAAAHPPESKLKKFAGYLKAVLKFLSGLMFILKAINKAWELLQKLVDFLL